MTIEATTKLDKEKAQKLQRQRETLIAQGASKSYPLQSSVSPKLYDAIGQLLLLSGATDEEFDMEKEQELKRFAQRLEKSEKAVLELLAQRCNHDVRSDDVTQKLKNATPTINPSQSCLSWRLSFTTMANDNKLDEEQQLGVIAAHKSKFTTLLYYHVNRRSRTRDVVRLKLCNRGRKTLINRAHCAQLQA